MATKEGTQEGIPRIFVRPQVSEQGVTGMIVDLGGIQLLIVGREISAYQQDIAFVVFRSITP